MNPWRDKNEPQIDFSLQPYSSVNPIPYHFVTTERPISPKPHVPGTKYVQPPSSSISSTLTLPSHWTYNDNPWIASQGPTSSFTTEDAPGMNLQWVNFAHPSSSTNARSDIASEGFLEDMCASAPVCNHVTVDNPKSQDKCPVTKIEQVLPPIHVSNNLLIPVLRRQVNSFKCGWEGCAYPGNFSSEYVLMRHIKSTHVSPGLYKCPDLNCDRSFGRRDKLSAHVRLVHAEKGHGRVGNCTCLA